MAYTFTIGGYSDATSAGVCNAWGSSQSAWWQSPNNPASGTFDDDTATCYAYVDAGMTTLYGGQTITRTGTAPPAPPASSPAPSGSFTQITCSVSPCDVSIAIAPASPASDPGFDGRVIDMAEVWGAFLVVLIVAACAKGVYRLFGSSPHAD